MKSIVKAAIFLAVPFFFIACRTTYKATDFTANEVRSNISNWPGKVKDAADVLISKYGQPDEMTSSMLIWRNNGIWEKTVLIRNEIPHDFPMSHTDYVQQTINYKVPVGKFDELARYDGSVIVERTKGTMSARCDKEEMNILALNLAHDVITGRRTVAQAREMYARLAKKFKDGGTDTYLQELLFTVSTGDTGDRDKTYR